MSGRYSRVVYSSTASGRLDLSDLENIEKISRQNNAANGITGLLYFDGRKFVQFLESQDLIALEQLLDKIGDDDRHHSLKTITLKASVRRLFPNWSMSVLAKDVVVEASFLNALDELLFTAESCDPFRKVDRIQLATRCALASWRFARSEYSKT